MAGIVAIGHVGITANDLGRLVSFYRDVVGLRLTVHHEGVVAIFEVGDTDFFLAPGGADSRREAGKLEFDLAADDVDAFREQLIDAGVDCGPAKTSRTTGHRSFTFIDPETNEVTVTSGHPRTLAGGSRGGSRASTAGRGRARGRPDR